MDKVERVGKTTHLQLRLVVDKRKMRLVYAECNRFMADVLLSFLTTPVGALVRRTGLGCTDSLYQSVEDMDVGQFRTRACRRLLLHPRSAFGFAHHRLKLWVNDAPVYIYGCPSLKCPKYSLFTGSNELNCESCSTNGLDFQCKNSEHNLFEWKPINPKRKGKRTTRRGGGYMRRPRTFIITNALVVKPIYDLGDNHLATGLEEKSLVVGPKEVRVLKFLYSILL